jgi:hypothetical protein
MNSITKDDTSINSRRQLLAIEMSEIYSQETRNFIIKNSVKNTILPNLESIYKKDNVIENDFNKSLAKHNHSSNIISNLKSILNNKERSPKKIKEDLNVLFNKKKKTKFENNTQNDTNELSTNSNSRHTNSPNDEKFDLLTKNISDDLIVEQSVLIQNPIKKYILFTNRTKSRFGFANEEATEENVEVPQKINDIINKKTSTYYFFKNSENSKAIFEEFITKNCDAEWKDFILSIKSPDEK